jgi:hypothetical protein
VKNEQDVTSQNQTPLAARVKNEQDITSQNQTPLTAGKIS